MNLWCIATRARGVGSPANHSTESLGPGQLRSATIRVFLVLESVMLQFRVPIAKTENVLIAAFWTKIFWPTVERNGYSDCGWAVEHCRQCSTGTNSMKWLKYRSFWYYLICDNIIHILMWIRVLELEMCTRTSREPQVIPYPQVWVIDFTTWMARYPIIAEDMLCPVNGYPGAHG